MDTTSASTLVFGTAALGLPYGLARAGAPVATMSEGDACRLVEFSLENGIDTFDTAPAYGLAERRLGLALGSRGSVWTKVHAAAGSLIQSVEASLLALERPSIDLLQWHNWTPASFDVRGVAESWASLRRDERVRRLGASTYGASDAREAVESGLFDVVQIEWNLLNQRVLREVGTPAARRQVAIALRSVFLQGALTDEGRTLPNRQALAQGVMRCRELARALSMSLEHLALRAALGQTEARWVLVGFDRPPQIGAARAIAGSPGVPDVSALDLDGHPDTDPRTW